MLGIDADPIQKGDLGSGNPWERAQDFDDREVRDREALGLLEVPVKPRKADTVVERVALVWIPG